MNLVALRVCAPLREHYLQPPLPRYITLSALVGGSYCLPGTQRKAQSFPVTLECFLETWFGSVSSAQRIVELLVF